MADYESYKNTLAGYASNISADEIDQASAQDQYSNDDIDNESKFTRKRHFDEIGDDSNNDDDENPFQSSSSSSQSSDSEESQFNQENNKKISRKKRKMKVESKQHYKMPIQYQPSYVTPIQQQQANYAVHNNTYQSNYYDFQTTNNFTNNINQAQQSPNNYLFENFAEFPQLANSYVETAETTDWENINVNDLFPYIHDEILFYANDDSNGFSKNKSFYGIDTNSTSSQDEFLDQLISMLDERS